MTLALCVLVLALGLVRGLPLGTMAATAIGLAVAAVPDSPPAVVTLGWSGTGIALTCAPAGFLAARLVRTAFRPPCPAGKDRASGLP
ncbi:hypothetical protein ACH4TP_13125 [Streptomyces sp. NPDC021012]|uniref:hypothetical protein n=1 Tax=Streptomyces sp. NPDC021012 TaxID=3365107 RepID=UPI0037897776